MHDLWWNGFSPALATLLSELLPFQAAGKGIQPTVIS
jgi:hypothetical protein